MKTKRITVIALAIVILLGLSTVVAFAASGLTNISMDKPPVYPTNEMGLTYGSAVDAISVETEPDLILAVGAGGIEGYVYSKDLQEEMPKSPEEAIAIMVALDEKMKDAEQEEAVVMRTIPLYAVDGKTVIGKFEITNLKNDARYE